jgi:hypothetical protein
MSEDRKPHEQLLDLFVYAPLGFLLNLEEVVPELVEKGRQQVSMARMFGQFAVQTGGAEARKRVSQVQERVQEQAIAVVGQVQGSARRPSGAPTPAAAPEPAAAPAAPATTGPVPRASDLAIPDYDSLSASQVVPRLEGLSAAERAAVGRYESAHRGRKTILAKLDQLG